jgi:hypothetical protein
MGATVTDGSADRSAVKTAHSATPAGRGATAPQEAGGTGIGATAMIAGLFLLGVALLIAVLVDVRAPFDPGSDFQLLAGFYIAAQAIERFIELVSRSPFPPDADAKDTRSVAQKKWIYAALAVLLGVGASLTFGLYFLEAVGANSAPAWADVFVTGLFISGGTKAVHELIGKIEASKEATRESLT